MSEKYEDVVGIDFSTMEEIKEPEQYRVILHNDDYTTKDFVVLILKDIFKKSDEEATVLMETVHKKGKATVGVFYYDIAATKIMQVTGNARKNGFPLSCTMELA